MSSSTNTIYVYTDKQGVTWSLEFLAETNLPRFATFRAKLFDAGGHTIPPSKQDQVLTIHESDILSVDVAPSSKALD